MSVEDTQTRSGEAVGKGGGVRVWGVLKLPTGVRGGFIWPDMEDIARAAAECLPPILWEFAGGQHSRQGATDVVLTLTLDRARLTWS